jgi:hypothetical protein
LAGDRVATFKQHEDGDGRSVENRLGRHRQMVESDGLPGINSARGAFGPVVFGARLDSQTPPIWDRDGRDLRSGSRIRSADEYSSASAMRERANLGTSPD